VWGQGGEMTQALYTHMNNKTIKKTVHLYLCLQIIAQVKCRKVKPTVWTHTSLCYSVLDEINLTLNSSLPSRQTGMGHNAVQRAPLADGLRWDVSSCGERASSVMCVITSNCAVS
jgi:hypothetical protein